MPQPTVPSSEPWPSYPRIDNSRQMPKQEGRSRSPRRAAALFGFAYAAVTSVVVLVDYSSETDKLDRGAYTDTFPPLGLAQAATLPLSAFLPQPEYQDLVSDERGVVRISERDRAAVAPYMCNIVQQPSGPPRPAASATSRSPRTG